MGFSLILLLLGLHDVRSIVFQRLTVIRIESFLLFLGRFELIRDKRRDLLSLFDPCLDVLVIIQCFSL